MTEQIKQIAERIKEIRESPEFLPKHWQLSWNSDRSIPEI